MRKGFLLLVLFIGVIVWEVIDNRLGREEGTIYVREKPPMDLPYEKTQALSHLNAIREAMSMQIFRVNTSLQIAAQAHADYLVLNKTASHYEREGDQGFFGTNAVKRAFKARYHSSYVIENLSTKNENAYHSVHSLFAAIYHRFSFLNLEIDEVGIGLQQDQHNIHNSAFVYNMGNSSLNKLCKKKSFKGNGAYVYNVCRDTSHRIGANIFHHAKDTIKKYNPKIIVYPYDRQTEVPPAFYEEVPDPLPNHEVSGFPVSIAFNDHDVKDVRLHTFRLYKQNGEEVTDVLLMDKSTDPHHILTPYQYALFPLKRLAYETQYRAEVEYEADGNKQKKVWHFKTVTPKETLYVIEEKEKNVSIKRGQGYIFYFVPLDAHEIMRDIRFPSNVYVEFLDHHTIKVMTMSETIDSFDIVSDTRTLHIEVE